MSEVFSTRTEAEDQSREPTKSDIDNVVDRIRTDHRFGRAFVREALDNYDETCYEGGYSSITGLDNLIECVERKMTNG